MKVFRGNDIRGVYGKELTDDLAYNLGKAFVKFTKAKRVVVGRDARLSSYALGKALIDGLTELGASVIDLGLVDTPGLYFASCHFNLPAIMITASHNPANENGFYLCKAMAKPINETNGLRKIEAFTRGKFVNAEVVGVVREGDISKEYANHVLSFVDTKNLKRLNVVADAGNGMGAWSGELVYSKLPLNVSRLYFNIDGKFPNRSPNTADSSALRGLQAEVLRRKAQFGFAFDGDADRVAFVDERGNVVEGSIIGAIVASYLLKKSKNKRIVYSSTCSKILPESVVRGRGKALIERVGHTFVQQRMWTSKALFGAENSGHYFYKDNWNADSGIITSLLMCQIYSESDKTFSQMVEPYLKYHKEEMSFSVGDPEKAFRKLKRDMRKYNYKIFDGMSFSEKDVWFSLRESETEPLIRLSIEGVSRDVVDKRKKEIIKMVESSLRSKK